MSDDPRDRAKEDLEVAQEAIADAREKLEQIEGDSAESADDIGLSGGGGSPGGGIDQNGGGGPPGGGPTED